MIEFKVGAINSIVYISLIAVLILLNAMKTKNRLNLAAWMHHGC